MQIVHIELFHAFIRPNSHVGQDSQALEYKGPHMPYI
jgi:hypothetical protein